MRKEEGGGGETTSSCLCIVLRDSSLHWKKDKGFAFAPLCVINLAADAKNFKRTLTIFNGNNTLVQ